MSDEQVDFADAAGKAMAALLLANCVMAGLVAKGIIPYQEAVHALDLARKTAANLQPHEVAVMALSALAGVEMNWRLSTA
jgi:hypothetical protein